ncbi:hypothetical protein Neosp_001888 [[Neocosmospora] mangrovei]
MPPQTTLSETHVPLLDSFLFTLDSHIEDLLVIENLPANQTEEHTRLDLLVKQCSLEADWALRTFRSYTAMKEAASPVSGNRRANRFREL